MTWTGRHVCTSVCAWSPPPLPLLLLWRRWCGRVLCGGGCQGAKETVCPSCGVFSAAGATWLPVAAECRWGVAPREWHYCCLLSLPWSVLDVPPLPHQCLVVLVWLGCGSVVGVVSRGWHCCRLLPLCPQTVPAGNHPSLQCLALSCHTHVVLQNKNSSELSNTHVFFYFIFIFCQSY